jgi:hypothetical protein
MSNTVAKALAMVPINVTEVVDATINEIASEFQGQQGTSNDITAQEAEMNQRMVAYSVFHQLEGLFTGQVKRMKQLLDEYVDRESIISPGIANETITLHEDNMFRFRKKRNANRTTTPLNAFIVELTKLGVDKKVIDKAKINASQPRKGNTYYMVELK